MSGASFTFDYSPYARHIRGVYLPVTLSVADRAAHLIIRADCASTYGVLERPWAAYFGLTWDSGDLYTSEQRSEDSRLTCMS